MQLISSLRCPQRAQWQKPRISNLFANRTLVTVASRESHLDYANATKMNRVSGGQTIRRTGKYTTFTRPARVALACFYIARSLRLGLWRETRASVRHSWTPLSLFLAWGRLGEVPPIGAIG